jgi:hypothetical protein
VCVADRRDVTAGLDGGVDDMRTRGLVRTPALASTGLRKLGFTSAGPARWTRGGVAITKKKRNSFWTAKVVTPAHAESPSPHASTPVPRHHWSLGGRARPASGRGAPGVVALQPGCGTPVHGAGRRCDDRYARRTVDLLGGCPHDDGAGGLARAAGRFVRRGARQRTLRDCGAPGPARPFRRASACAAPACLSKTGPSPSGCPADLVVSLCPQPAPGGRPPAFRRFLFCSLPLETTVLHRC